MKNIFLFFLILLIALTWAELDLKEFCSDKKVNEVVVHPDDCGGYIVCSEEPTVDYCEEGFHFDIKSLVCNWPQKVNCQLAARQGVQDKEFVEPLLTAFEAFDAMTGQVTEPMLGYDPLKVVCRHFGSYFLPNPQQCRSYYLCAYGHIHEHVCGNHTLWDYKLEQCVLSHQANCYRYTEQEEKELNVALNNATMVCYPIKSNNSMLETVYFNTTKPATTLTTTIKTTTTITPTITKPITIKNIKSTTAIPTPSTINPTEKSIISNPFNITCPLKHQSYVAHPKDCSKYFMCIMGTAVPTSCPQGHLWDAKKNYCDTRKNVKCFR